MNMNRFKVFKLKGKYYIGNDIVVFFCVIDF